MFSIITERETTQKYLDGIAHALRKIGRDMPKSSFSTKTGQEESFHESVERVAKHSNNDTLSKIPANPSLIAGQSSPY